MFQWAAREEKGRTMYRVLLSSLLLLFTAPTPPTRAQGDLSRSRDKNRLLLVFAPSASDPRWARQNALLAGSRAQFADRALLRFDVFEHGKHQDAGLRARYHVRPGSFRVLLVGKDGHAAFGGPAPVPISDLTARIDRMPMRRDEMRRRGEGAAR